MFVILYSERKLGVWQIVTFQMGWWTLFVLYWWEVNENVSVTLPTAL